MDPINSDESKSDQTLVRVGFLSTATITKKSARAIKESRKATVAAVSSRSKEKAQKLAAELGANQSFGPHTELLNDPSIHAVYIPLPTALHKDWVKEAAKLGKHVVCEKPCATSHEELVDMITSCADSGVAWMDGVMFMHHQRLNMMGAKLWNTDFGPVQRVNCNFSFCGDEEFFSSNIRLDKDLEPMGALGDLGWYCIRFALWAFRWEMPHTVSATIEREVSGVPTQMRCQLKYSDSRAADLHFSFHLPFRQTAEVMSSSSVLSLDDFCISRSQRSCMFQVVRNSRLENLATDVVEERSEIEVKNCSQEAELWSHFCDLVTTSEARRSGQLEFWRTVSLATQLVMDACYAAGTEEKDVPVDPDLRGRYSIAMQKHFDSVSCKPSL